MKKIGTMLTALAIAGGAWGGLLDKVKNWGLEDGPDDRETPSATSASDSGSTVSRPLPGGASLPPVSARFASDKDLFHLMADDPQAAFKRFFGMSEQDATDAFRRMTGDLPGEFQGFFADFLRWGVPWEEYAPDGTLFRCCYNPWCDGALVVAIRHAGTDAAPVLECPAILSGEALRGAPLPDAAAPVPPTLVPAGGDVLGDTLAKTTRTRSGFRRLARSDSWQTPGAFDSWSEEDRRLHLKPVFGRMGALFRERSAVVCLEKNKDPAAVRYGDFIEAFARGDAKPASSSAKILSPEAAGEWRQLPSSFRRGLCPVRAVRYKGGMLTVWQNRALPGIAVVVFLGDTAESGTDFVRILDFGD